MLAAARAEIDRCFPDGPPPILDPFARGGTIPLEAQRLGLTALAGDLNPVAVLINKAMIEIPPRFAGRSPVHPGIDLALTSWDRAQGLAADVEAYGRWMQDEAEQRIGHLYPDATGPDGERLTPIAWIWARTVESPDPTWSGHVPLVTSWVLANKRGKPKIWVEPVVDRDTQSVWYRIHEGGEPIFERTVKAGHGRCIATGSAIPNDYIKAEGCSGRMGSQLIAVVAEGARGRVYCEPTTIDQNASCCDLPQVMPLGRTSDHPQYMGMPRYGFDEWWKLFTPRQLLTLDTFSELLGEVVERINEDVQAGEMSTDGLRLREHGHGTAAYVDAVATYLAFCIDRVAARWSHLCVWHTTGEKLEHIFRLNAFQMTWTYAEGNPFSKSSGNWQGQIRWITKVLENLPMSGTSGVEVHQRDARARVRESIGAVISTDPPYYDNIPYADLSDFFYVWLRRNVSDIWPDECATLLAPKAEELVANQYRAGSKKAAEDYFESGMAEFMAEVAKRHPTYAPATIYYAYKATETKDGEIRLTGWDTFLQAIVDSGMMITATWPIRTEMPGGTRMAGRSVLASSVVLSCRVRPDDARLSTRAEFLGDLRNELPEALNKLQSGNVLPVDLAQSAIGPGIRVFSRYARVVEADGSTMPVRRALAIINDVLGEVLDGAEAELDAETRFALAWFSEHGWNPGPSGDADSLARAKNSSLAGIAEAGVGVARAGEFRLHERSELAEGWSPMGDTRLTVWEAAQYLVLALERSQSDAAALLQRLGGYGDRARQLAYLLFQKASDNGWAAEAGVYNGLITAWPSLRAADVEVESPRLL